MKVSNHSAVPVYTISGASTARPLPEWLARKRKRSLKSDPEYASRIELLQDFEFEEASQCIRASDDGQWVMSTGMPLLQAQNMSNSKQEPTSLRFMPITFLISPYPSPDIRLLLTRHSYFSLMIIRNPFTSRPTALLSFTLLEDAITPRDCLAMAGISNMTADRLRLSFRPLGSMKMVWVRCSGST